MIKRTLIAAAVLALIPMTGMAQEVGHAVVNNQISFQAFESSIADYDGDSVSTELGKSSYSGPYDRNAEGAWMAQDWVGDMNGAHSYAIGRDAEEAWVVGDIAADNGLTVAVEVGDIDPQGSVRRTSVAMLDGIVFTDSRHRREVRIRIDHNCSTGRSKVLDYREIASNGQQSWISQEKAAIKRKGYMAWQFPERLSPVAEATVQETICQAPQASRRKYSSPAEAERWVLRTDYANSPDIALERAHRIVLVNRDVIFDALWRMAHGECNAQRSSLFSALEKRDAYLRKLAYAADGRDGAGLHAGSAIVQSNDDAMDFEQSAVRYARQCLGDSSPLPAQGVVIPKELMPIKDGE